MCMYVEVSIKYSATFFVFPAIARGAKCSCMALWRPMQWQMTKMMSKRKKADIKTDQDSYCRVGVINEESKLSVAPLLSIVRCCC